MFKYLQKHVSTLHVIYKKVITGLLCSSQTWRVEVRKYVFKIISQEGKNLTITRLSKLYAFLSQIIKEV